jgi:hypothetical protein
VRWATLNGLSRNSHLAVLDDSLFVAGRISGRSDRTDAGTIHVWRLNLQGETVSSQQCADRSERGQWSVSHLGSHGKRLVLWLTQPGENRRELTASVSDDAGQTWRPLLAKPTPTDSFMPEVEERLPVVSQPDKRLFAAFVSQAVAPGRPGQMLLRSADGGANWQQAAPPLHDDGGPDESRLVLAAAPVEGELVAAYLSARKQEQTGQLYVARSADGGQTWSRGQAVSEKRPWLPLRTRLLPAGELLALSFREAHEDSGAVGRLSVSHDRGQTWRQLPLAEFYRGPLMSTWALAASPAGDRLICGAVVNMPNEAGGRTYFTLQEYSPRATPKPGSGLQAAIARKIAELGEDNYNTRQQASRDLEGMGRDAKEQLLVAYRASNDAEVRKRLKVILAKMFPACLQIR